jgi:tRNA A-37 threonylcarbamoyl transferase component Bud32
MDYIAACRMVSPAAQRPVHQCMGEDTLWAFADGQLSAAEAARVEDHLGRCAACGELVAHAMAMSGARANLERSRSSAPDGAAPPLEPGTEVGRYVVLEPVGAGAMSTVYAAHDPELDRRVALKLLRTGGPDDELRARLYREAKAMARIAHPHVITVHDVGVYGSQLFVAMELVPGGTLRQWLAASPRGWRDVVATFVQAGRGLACAHAAGLVHRDFKPDNVLVGDDGRVRVTDFGLARAATHDDPRPAEPSTLVPDVATTITRTGAIVGTPAYMAPEQLRGEPADSRADVFAFCVALHEALYGERPFEGRSVVGLRSSTAAGIVRPPPRDSSVPGALRAVLLVGLRPQPDDRYASMGELLLALEAAARGPRRGRAVFVWAMAALVGVAAVGGLAALAQSRAGAPEANDVAPPAPVEHPILAWAPGPPTAADPPTIVPTAAPPARPAQASRLPAAALPPPPAKSAPAAPGALVAAAPAESEATRAAPPVPVTPAAPDLGGAATRDRR